MPVSTLNRIVSMFIVGGVPVVWYVLRQPGWLPPSELSAVMTGFVLIPVSAIFGAAGDAAGRLLRQYVIDLASKDKGLAGWFGQTSQFDTLQMWRWTLEDLMIGERRIALVGQVPEKRTAPPSVKLDDYVAGVAMLKGSK